MKEDIDFGQVRMRMFLCRVQRQLGTSKTVNDCVFFVDDDFNMGYITVMMKV